MPRTDKSEHWGCPPLRALCFDSLGLIKAVEVQPNKQEPQIVARWGEANKEGCVLSVSLSDEQTPALAVARKRGVVDILDPTTGLQLKTTRASVDDPCLETKSGCGSLITGIHLFRADNFGRRSLLTCTEEGCATLEPVLLEDGQPGYSQHILRDEAMHLPVKWRVCNLGSILRLRVDSSERHAAFGGKGVDVNVWDVEKQSKIWDAKAPRSNSMGLISPAFVTALAFLCKDDHRKVVAGTGHHQVRLYDIGVQRRPVLAFDFRESPIKAVEQDFDGFSVFVGTGSGDLGSFDMRTGKFLGGFKGKCTGSIRSIARHPELPIIATCGLDRFLRFFAIRTRKLLMKVFLKQQLTAVVFDGKTSFPASLKADYSACR
eukprot:c27764_g1_i4 orf=28-1152(+)